jgi:hypothetical protein
MRFLNSARRQYDARGYRVLRRLFPAAEIASTADLTRHLILPYVGKLRRQDGQFAPNDLFEASTVLRNSVLHAHASLPPELAELQSRLCALVTAPELGERLRDLDGERHHYIVHQTLLFFAAQTTELHLDSWSLDTAPLGGSHTIWVPLQDLDYRSGVPSVIPWPRRKAVPEKELGLPEEGERDERYNRYHVALRGHLLSNSPEAVTPLLRMGDAVVWSSLTPHFTLPAQTYPVERLSLQVLIRPAKARWGDFLSQPFDKTSLQLRRVNDHFSIRVLT